MRILVLSNKIPYPPIDGGSIATLNLSLALAKLGNPISMLTMNTAKHNFPVEQIPSEIKDHIEIQSVDVPAKIKPVDALINIVFSKYPYTAERFFTNPFKNALTKLLNEKTFDIIQLEGLYLGLYVPIIRKHSNAKIVYRAHNLEFEIWERASVRSVGFKKWYLKNLSNRLIRFEKDLLRQYDAILPISDKDSKWFLKHFKEIRLHTTPAGITNTVQDKTMETAEKEIDLFYIGALDWLPNQEGLIWFFKNVWPSIHKQYPKLKFYLAGRNASKEMKDLKAEGLIFLGEIDDAQTYMKAHSIMLVPLFSGSGMRVKIIEAMALSKAVISTRLGLEGNSAKDNIEVCIADSAEEFMDKIKLLISNPDQIKKMGLAASEFVQTHFNQRTIAQKAELFYKTL